MVRQSFGIVVLFGFLCSGSSCLKLDAGLDLPSLLSLVSSRTAIAFFNDASGDGQARSLLRINSSDNLERIDWTAGPAQIRDAAIVNGVIVAADTSNSDDFWISRDGGRNWSSVDLPSGNESQGIFYVLECGNAVVVTQANIAYDGTGSRPGYISRDNGATWTEFRAGIGPSSTGTGDIGVRGIACNADNIYIASSGATNRIQYASLSNLSSWTGAPNAGVSYLDYTDLTATSTGFAGLAQDDGNAAQCGLNYSTNGGASVTESGFMPNLAACNGGLRSGSPNGNERIIIAEPDTLSDVCRVYTKSSLASAPTTPEAFSYDCSDVVNLGDMPGILYGFQGIFVSYVDASRTATGLLYSSDGGQSFQKLNIGTVWSDSGYIIDIEESP